MSDAFTSVFSTGCELSITVSSDMATVSVSARELARPCLRRRSAISRNALRSVLVSPPSGRSSRSRSLSIRAWSAATFSSAQAFSKLITLSDSRRPGVGAISSGGLGSVATGLSSLATSSPSARTSSSSTGVAVSTGSLTGLRACGMPPASTSPISSGSFSASAGRTRPKPRKPVNSRSRE